MFDPQAREQPSFAELQRRFGVPDQETYDFLRLAHETFAVRTGSDPAAPVIPADEYFAYTELAEDGDTIVPARDGSEVRLRPRRGAARHGSSMPAGASRPSSFRSPRRAMCPA